MLTRKETIKVLDSIVDFKYSSLDVVKTWFVGTFGNCFNRLKLTKK
jgi:hypothetical protein